MPCKYLRYLFFSALVIAQAVEANVTNEDFVAKTTQNLLNLCSVSLEDPHYREALHFCQGYLVGAFQFHQAQAADKPDLKLVCFSEPLPTRNQAIDMFITWARQHPEYMNEMPVETEFRFLTEKWPCK